MIATKEMIYLHHIILHQDILSVGPMHVSSIYIGPKLNVS